MAADRTTSTRDSEQAIAAALQRYRVMANVVGVLLIALICVAVPLKYFGGMREPVVILGTAHGWLYALTILAGTIPVLSFYSERNATRKTRAGERV
jgi:hypothetical protein